MTIRMWDGVVDVEDVRLSLPSVLGMFFCTVTAGVAYWLMSSNRRGREADGIDRVRSIGWLFSTL